MVGPIRTNDTPAEGASSTTTTRTTTVQPPRPPNAWILYRSDKLRQLPPAKGRPQADVSKMISKMWAEETDTVRLLYERMADARKAEHQRKYPEYRFQPVKKEERAKMREQQKVERERARAEKKSKRRATSARPAAQPPPVSTPVPAPSAPAATSPVVYATQYGMPPGYAMMQMSYYVTPHISNEARFGPAGPSPPISAAPSPQETSASPEPQPITEEQPTPSTSTAILPLPTSESQHSTASQHSLANTQYAPQSLLSAELPPLVPHVPQPDQGSQVQGIEDYWQPSLPQSDQSQASSSCEPMQSPTPDWNNLTSSQLPPVDAQYQDFLNFDVGFPENHSFAQQSITDLLQFEGLQDIMSMSTGDGFFGLANLDPLSLVSHPQGELEVSVGVDVQPRDFSGELFANFDFSALEQPMDLNPATAVNDANDLASLLQAPSAPEEQAYSAARQRQPSIFTQDVMQFLNLEVAEGVLQDATVLPAASTVSPQQVRAHPQPPPHAQPMPIFTQVTNTPVAGQYVPPAGAANSTVRRVGGSWKPPVTIPESLDEQTSHHWDFSAA
ncbi:hypothetical protein F5J12DRAFT_887668 [Pisolithus orientalis]|uniref:uncharacterized protein n=1 Tax=Pisolithus orientalis TaxID=936130 RepID=UPI002225412B|nr:uncharacterized protein F5J12DRAFT_887668 [Pisolithus orientalis]KAI6032779.1 hypothetical protein F5J12DRAFT_887668 [Pisolithus orientalis]